MSEKKIGVAVIGSGNRGLFLARLCVKHCPTADLKIACDINEETAIAAAKECDIPAHCTDYMSAIEHPGVDAVIIATPPFVHKEQVVAAARAGKHVLCEKPLSIKLSDSDEMLAACEEAGVFLMTGYPLRYGECRLKLRRMLLDGVIGRPVLWCETLPPSIENQPFTLKYELGGGPLFEYSHSIDFACYVFGPPASVHANMFSFNPRGESYDSVSMRIKFKSGDVFCLSMFGVFPNGMKEALKARTHKRFGGDHRWRQNDIVGPEGCMFTGLAKDADELAVPTLVVSKDVGLETQVVEEYPWLRGEMAPPSSIPMIQDFLARIESGDYDSRNSGQQSRQNIAILQACIESVEADQVIHFD